MPTLYLLFFSNVFFIRIRQYHHLQPGAQSRGAYNRQYQFYCPFSSAEVKQQLTLLMQESPPAEEKDHTQSGRTSGVASFPLTQLTAEIPKTTGCYSRQQASLPPRQCGWTPHLRFFAEQLPECLSTSAGTQNQLHPSQKKMASEDHAHKITAAFMINVIHWGYFKWN